MQTVSSVMTAAPVTVTDDAKLTDAARIMRGHAIGAAPPGYPRKWEDGR